MNSENDDTDDTNNNILWFEKPQPSSAPRLQAALPASLPASSTASNKPDRFLESFIFGFFRSGVRVALYLACAYAAKIALGIGHLSLALR